MKLIKNCCFILGIFLLLFQKTLAQRGYNYARPGFGVATAAGSSNVGASIPTANGLRPIVAALPTGNAATVPGFATAATAFGAPSTANTVQGTTAFGAFPAQAQRPLTPTAATSTFGGAVTGVIGRPAATQRTAGALFGTNLGRAQTTQYSGIAVTTGTGSAADYEGEGDYSAIPGVPGVDYPIFSQVPPTSFDCAQQVLPGYYSDVEAQCQVFHICALNRTYSFLCPNGTVFSQEVLVCVWWNQYDCATAPELYANNAFIYDYGSRVTPTDATSGYQTGTSTQLSIGGTTRSQSNFPIATNTARTSTAVQPAGIFGNSLGLRPTVTSGGFGGITTPITPAPTAAFGSRTSSGRFPQPATPAPQTFPSNAAVISTASISDIGGTATGALGVPGGIGGIQPNALQTAQLVTSSTNREYLPPAQRP